MCWCVCYSGCTSLHSNLLENSNTSASAVVFDSHEDTEIERTLILLIDSSTHSLASRSSIRCETVSFVAMKFYTLLLSVLFVPSEAYTVARREVLSAFGAAAAIVPAAAQAVDACPPKSSNCIRTTWTPPAGTSKADAASTVRSILNDYPQEGTDAAVSLSSHRNLVSSDGDIRHLTFATVSTS